MASRVYRYSFDPGVKSEEVEAVLVLAFVAAEALHGEARVRLEGAYHFDAEKRACVLAADTPVGKDLNKLFIAFLQRGRDGTVFTVEAVSHPKSRRRAARV